MTYIILDTSDEANKISEQIKKEELNNERGEYTTRGTSGFINIGNTCYMNSALQCLLATDLLGSYFRGHENENCAEYKSDLKRSICNLIIAEDEKKKNNKSSNNCKKIVDLQRLRKKFRNTLTYKVRNIFCVSWGSNVKIKPTGFKERLGVASKEFLGWSQNDSQECLSLVLDTIHEETKSEVELEMNPLPVDVEQFKKMREKILKNSTSSNKEYIKYKALHLKECAIIESLEFWKNYIKNNHSVIEDIFTGLFFNTVKCCKCNNSSLNFEPFKIINLPIPNDNNIDGSILTLKECFDKEYGNGVQLVGENQYYCDICTCKTDAIKTTELWHCPHRLIIHFKRFDNQLHKNTQKIDFPINNLDLSCYVSNFIEGTHMYDLYAISYHSGSLKGGHYTAYTKNPLNNKWYYYDDSHVLHIPDENLEQKLITPGAYVLLYKKKDNSEIY